MIYRTYFKKTLDTAGAALGLIVAFPVLAIAALAVALDDGFPVIFRQLRVGRNGEPFVVFKLRSMPTWTPQVSSVDAAQLSPTRVGRITRRLNIDELPQLLNVLLGEMSLVGPRPALASQKYLTEMRTKNGALSIRPGLTGLAQVCSYDGMPEAEKANLDGEYARNISLRTDVSVLFKTIRYLTKRPPVY